MANSQYYEKAVESLTMFSKLSPIHAFILDKGFRVIGESLSENEKKVLEELIDATSSMCDFQMKECFHNSQMLVYVWESSNLKDKHPNIDLDYAEGYVFTPGTENFPILHGFILINDKIVDLTLRVRDPNYESIIEGYEDRTIGLIPKGYVYFGYKLPNEDVVEQIETKNRTQTLLDNWEDGWPYLKEYSPKKRKRKK